MECNITVNAHLFCHLESKHVGISEFRGQKTLRKYSSQH